ncbi:GTP cyclohydrolase I [Micromonospora sp. NPDC051925]|uniref:GTP cyclohydrolase I n=1 Tax=Micromonospora sp. NPDC051925 TaxID=3364288 RepID=UPI0037C881DC
MQAGTQVIARSIVGDHDDQSEDRSRRPVDRQAAETAVAALLTALGVQPGSEVALNTPRRVAAAFEEMLTAPKFNPTTFAVDQVQQDLVLARNVPFRSVCAHHLLPFVGMAQVGYLPGSRILGLSKFARVVDMFARGLQVQEELTRQVADWVDAELGARGAAVVITAEHLCMTARGVRAAGTSASTVAWRGAFRHDAAARAEFLAAIQTGTPA